MFVTMTHEDRPGVEVLAEQNSYRYTWYPKGWRSADDPSWVGATLTPAVPHASDTSLHGGGQELDYAELTADASFTATGFNTGAIADLTVFVPLLDRPVYLHADLRAGPVTTTSALTLAMSPVAGAGTTGITNARGAKTLYAVPAVGSEPNGRPVQVFHRVPPGGGGEDWCVVGVINSGATTARVLATNPQSRPSLRAVAM